MERPEFDITISRAGKVKVHVKGVKGQRCVELADLIQEIVGGENERTLTNEFHLQEGSVRIQTRVREQGSD